MDQQTYNNRTQQADPSLLMCIHGLTLGVVAGLVGRQAAVRHLNSDRRSVCTDKHPAAVSERRQLIIIY